MIVAIADRVQTAYNKHASLVKNSGAVMIGAGSTSVLGFVYWWLAARSFPPETIGIVSALISLMGFVGVIGEAGLGTLLMGELGYLPKRKEGLISAALVTCSLTCLVVGGIAILFSEIVTVTTKTDNTYAILVLLIGCGLSGLCMMTDQAFIAMLQGAFRAWRQFSFSVLRLSLLVTLPLVFAFSDQMILLVSWVAALAGSWFLSEWTMRHYEQSLVHRPDFDLLWTLKRRAFDHYLLDLGVMSPPMIMPYLVTAMISATSNAAFTIIWMVIAIASIVPSATAIVLFPVLRKEPEQYQEKMRLSLFVTLAFAVIFGIGLYLFSAKILAVFNPQYVEIGGPLLGLLGFGLIGSVIKYHVCAAARLGNRMRKASFWICLGTLFELAGAGVGAVIAGLDGLSIGWPIASIIEGILMLIFTNPCVKRTPLLYGREV